MSKPESETAPGIHIRSTDPDRKSRVEERIAEAARHRLAGARLAFLAKICRDRLGYANRHNESNAEMIGRVLNDYADRHPMVGATRYGG